ALASAAGSALSALPGVGPSLARRGSSVSSESDIGSRMKTGTPGLTGISTAAGQKSRDKAAEQAGGVIDHRDDAGVIEPRRADHAEHADDAVLGVLERRYDQRGP